MKFVTFLKFILKKLFWQKKLPDHALPNLSPEVNFVRPGQFFLDETSLFDIKGSPKGLDYPRWMYITHCNDKRYALNLLPGEEMLINTPVVISRDSRLFVRYAASLPEIGTSGMSCDISFFALEHLNQYETNYPIAILPIPGGKQNSEWRSAEFNIGWLAGRQGQFCVSCRAGSNGDSSRIWLAVSDFCIAQKDQVSLVKSRSFKALRIRNEAEHFNFVYKHSMYSKVQDQQSELARGKLRVVRELEPDGIIHKTMDKEFMPILEPITNEAAYNYASRLLSASIIQIQPDFKKRLMQRAETQDRVRVLSLCSGAARIEAGYAAHLDKNVEWSLLDINKDLLCMASTQFSPLVKIDLIQANVNELSYTGEKWDIILCVSALHHVVELEKLISFCHNSLNTGGEFWSIGEYVGRNGNRLWPDAYAEANRFFKTLPEEFRLNQHTNQVDQVIPYNDYSVGCFEGIRSEDIEPILDRWFHRVDVYKVNCFLWRLMNLAYCDNYNIDDFKERALVIKAVQAEMTYYQNGGQGTELYGVYSPIMF